MKISFKFITALTFCLICHASLVFADNGYVFRGGTCVLRGSIKGIPSSEMPKGFTIQFINLVLNENANHLVKIRQDGSINETVPLPHSQFASCPYFEKSVFFMVGDTIDFVYEPDKGLQFSSNNTTTQVNQYLQPLLTQFYGNLKNKPSQKSSKEEYEDFFVTNYKLADKVLKEFDQSLPEDCQPMAKEVLKISLLSQALVNVLNGRLDYFLGPKGAFHGNYRPLETKNFYAFLRKHEQQLLNNPYLLMNCNSWLPFNRMVFDADLFDKFASDVEYYLDVEDDVEESIGRYAHSYLLPKNYDPQFINEAKALRSDSIFTFSDLLEIRLNEFKEKTELHNNVALQVALCNQFNKYCKDGKYEGGDYLAERLNAILPLITRYEIRHHLLQRYRQCVIEHEGTSEAGLESDSVFQDLIRPYKGNVLYIDFWGMGCGPCRAGLKNQRSLVEKMKGRPVRFLYVCNETDSSREHAEEWMKKNDIQGEHIYVSRDTWEYLQTHFQFSAIPFSLTLDKKGRIVKESINLFGEDFEKLVND